MNTIEMKEPFTTEKPRSGKTVKRPYLKPELRRKLSLIKNSNKAEIFLNSIDKSSFEYQAALKCGKEFPCGLRGCPVCADLQNIRLKKRLEDIFEEQWIYTKKVRIRQITFLFEKERFSEVLKQINQLKRLKEFKKNIQGFLQVCGRERIALFYDGEFWKKEDIQRLMPGVEIWMQEVTDDKKIGLFKTAATVAGNIIQNNFKWETVEDLKFIKDKHRRLLTTGGGFHKNQGIRLRKEANRGKTKTSIKRDLAYRNFHKKIAIKQYNENILKTKEEFIEGKISKETFKFIIKDCKEFLKWVRSDHKKYLQTLKEEKNG